MAHVPDDAVMRRVEYLMQGQRQFHRAQVGRQVPAGLGDRFQHESAQLLGQPFQLAAVQAPEVGRGLDAVQKFCRHACRHAVVAVRCPGLQPGRACQGSAIPKYDEIGQLGQARARVAQRFQRRQRGRAQFPAKARASSGPAGTRRWACSRRRPCPASCPGWRCPPSRPGCRPPPGRPGPWPARTHPAPGARPSWRRPRCRPAPRCTPPSRRSSCCAWSAIHRATAHGRR